MCIAGPPMTLLLVHHQSFLGTLWIDTDFVSPNTLLKNALKITCKYQSVQQILDFNPIENLWEELRKKKQQAFDPDSISVFQ